jgi:beta-glucosidase-like glycosyl hydrolase/CubicO group peptidase (beta-lactamase class C family)
MGSFRVYLMVLFSVAFYAAGFGQSAAEMQKAERWADSVYNTLTLKERIGQLIFVRANYSGSPYLKEVSNYIRKYKIGGVCFFAGDPVDQANQFNKWNRISKVPLMSTIDAEWGLAMRLKNTVKYPLQMTLGALENKDLIYEMGRQIGEQCRRAGIHFNFAPVVDVNSNPKNPVIGMRSFGENPMEVGQRGYLYMKGLQDEGVVACAKHFPGHGDTYKDSHKTLPVVDAPLDKMVNTGLVPFKYLIRGGVESVMVAHLSVPAFDTLKNHPATLSYDIVTGLLKQKLGFKGLVVTDGLDMKGVTKNYGADSVAYLAFSAGNDLLLIPDDIPSSVKTIYDAVKSGKIPESRVEESCKKILKYKYLSGAATQQYVKIEGLVKDLNRKEYKTLSDRLYKESITLVKNRGDLLPLKKDGKKIMMVVIGETGKTTFGSLCDSKCKAKKSFYLPHDASKKDINWVLKQSGKYDYAVVALLNTNMLAKKHFGISKTDIGLIDSLAVRTKVILDVFASPYALDFFSNLEKIPAIIISYQDKAVSQEASVEVITGKRVPTGKLPVSAGGFDAGTGISDFFTSFDYMKPEELGINTEILKKVDSTALNGIEIKAFPGCRILAAKDGHIFYNKSFGYLTYDQKVPVNNNIIYDLASLTKILATTLSLMKLEETGKLDVDKKLVDYLPMLQGTNKEDLGFREVLTHQAGLTPWIPYYDSTLRDYGPDTTIYHKKISEDYPTRVAENMYIRKNYSYEIYREILESPMGKKEYKYSDLGFYLFRKMVEDIANKPLEDFVQEEFYGPMGLEHISYLPRKKFPLVMIAPTEDDTIFRKQVLRGDVHDQGAAMLGGVSGHAGLFGTAHDVAAVMQMLMNGGVYNGVQVLDPEVISMFTACQFPEKDNRRGLGFDKPLLEYEEHRTNCKSASPSSFGHSGFTGVYTWADPETGLVYVFLSNRVYPDADNNKISDLDIRTNIHQLFYDALKK